MNSETPSRPETTSPYLLPCPFCGHAEIDFLKAPANWKYDDYDNASWLAAHCKECGAFGPLFGFMSFHDERAATIYWNRRAPLAPTLQPQGEKWTYMTVFSKGYVSHFNVMTERGKVIYQGATSEKQVKTLIDAHNASLVRSLLRVIHRTKCSQRRKA